MRTLSCLLLMATAVAVSSPSLLAQDVTFKAPVMMKAGDAPLGGKMLYPSPCVVDIDADGQLDVVLGDLRGVVTFARGTGEAGASALEKEVRLQTQDGKPIDFHNW